jgi:ABC-type Mn2+/Zn2+ transport system permease subunit
VLTAIGGLFASYGLDVPSGATIILGQALLFFAALLGTTR